MLGCILGGAGEPFRGGGDQTDSAPPYFRFFGIDCGFGMCHPREIMLKSCAMKHRATGRPRGRPPKLPTELPEQVMCDLESRMDKTTLLVAPQLGPLAKKLNISRSSLKRIVVSLRNSGFIELCHVKKRPTDKLFTILYKLPRSLEANGSAPSGS